MLLCPPVYWNTESQNSQDTACSIYVLWKTWLKRKRKTAMLYFYCQLSCEVWRGGRGWERDTDRERRVEESDFLHPQILSWWWQGTGLSEPPPPQYLHPHLPLWCLSLLLFFPPSLLLTGGVCEVSPERHRLKDGIYKIHTEPTFNWLWRTSPAAFDVQT